jgi:hypothetical protein
MPTLDHRSVFQLISSSKVDAALIETLTLSGPPICELVAWLILVDIGTKTPAGKRTSWRYWCVPRRLVLPLF